MAAAQATAACRDKGSGGGTLRVTDIGSSSAITPLVAVTIAAVPPAILIPIAATRIIASDDEDLRPATVRPARPVRCAMKAGSATLARLGGRCCGKSNRSRDETDRGNGFH